MKRKADVRWVAERRYWRESEARVLVDAWRRSGETLSGFARRHGVERGRLTRWVRRLQEARKGSVRFHPVRLVESTAETGGGAPIEIQLAGGRRVRVPRGFETEDLRRVLAVLERAATC
jgi:transposase-like protein